MRRRCYLIVRYRPEFDLDPGLADALPAWLPGSRARRNGHPDGARQVRERSLREHRRVVRRALNRVRGFVRRISPRDGVQARVLNGGEVLRYLVSRCNPTSATWGRLEARAGWDGVLSRFDSPVEREEAQGGGAPAARADRGAARSTSGATSTTARSSRTWCAPAISAAARRARACSGCASCSTSRCRSR